ncbi:hypothetical protein GCM10010104_32870 [Streptomyces indiaensis]|uniref:Zinc finger CGNR domain-containing protein n=1 Tax=Streptomyces indiaensis TaxID=284033 RepID=A0ABN3DLB8_9ACTN
MRHLNEAAARTPTVPVLDWPAGAGPNVRRRPVGAGDDLTAALAHAVIAFPPSSERDRLRACDAPRCGRYFLKEHPRQEWCKPSCGNRARVARHHQRHKATAWTDRHGAGAVTPPGTRRPPGRTGAAPVTRHHTRRMVSTRLLGPRFAGRGTYHGRHVVPPPPQRHSRRARLRRTGHGPG